MTNLKLATLVDPFTGTSITTSVWNASFGNNPPTLDAVNDRVTIPVQSGAAGYNGLGSGTWDATGSSVYARIGAAPNGAGGVSTIFQLQVDANNGVRAQVLSGGVFQLQVYTGGVYVTTNLPTYNPSTHAWWKLAESGGQFTFSTSSDGMTWTALATMSYSWNATAMSFFVIAGASDVEPSGMSAWVAHVNTPLGGQFNPNWPLSSYEWGAQWNCNGAAQPLDSYVGVSPRTRGRVSTQRGRQYELDQVRSGTLDMALVNTDGALDPLNTSSPWYGHVMPYQPSRLRMQWPASINLLTQVQATAGDLGGYSTGAIPAGQQGISVFTTTDPGSGSIVATSSAWQGGTVFQFTVPASTAAGGAPCYTPQVAFVPGGTYTMQMQVRNVTPSTTLQMQPFVRWHAASGATISTPVGATVSLVGSATAAWTQLTLTVTVPANAAFGNAGAWLPSASPASAVSLQVDGWQVEQGSQASAWTCPGVTYPVYSGFVERLPQSWTMQGTYGTVGTTSTDTFSLLSQRVLRDPLMEETYSRGLRFLYTLSDPQGSNSFADAIGAYAPAPIAVSKYGAGTLTSGTQITSATTGGTYTGSTGTVVTVNNPNPGTNLLSAASFVSLSSAGITGPASSSSWTRMIAFRYTAGSNPTNGAYMWSAMDSRGPSGSQLHWLITSAGQFQLVMFGSSGSGVNFIPSAANVADGNWHLVIGSYSHANAQLIINLDGTSYYYGSFNPIYEPTGLISDNIGSYVDPSSGNGTSYNWRGDISYVAEFTGALDGTGMTSIYNAWKNSFNGDSTDARYNRILGWAGFSGPTSIQTGMTKSMGAAATGGQDALSALQAVVDTENGAHYVDRQGWVTFKARSDRYNKLTPTYTLGERTDLGEIPYEDISLDYDPTRLANQVKVTQASTSQVFSAQDTTSQANYFPRQLTRTSNASSPQECQDSANYLVSRYKNPAVRVSALKLHPSANPSLMWPVCLSLELGTRIRVMRRPPAPAAAIQLDLFVENIAWEFDDTGDAYVSLQCSPVDQTPYGLFASWHTTLAGSGTIAAGATTITINNGQDNTNPLAAQLPVNGQLTIGQNTANQETVTIQSIGATSPGWTTATIQLASATTKSHTGGDTVCEPLPVGVTDPTTWDAVSKFDSTAFAY